MELLLVAGGIVVGTLGGWLLWGRQRHQLVRETTELRTRLTSMDLDRQRLMGDLDSAQTQLEHLARARSRPGRPAPRPSADMIVVLDELEMDDTLQNIKGVGPKLALLLAAEGINNLARLANLSDGALEHLAVRLPAVAERIRREEWREQAREIVALRSKGEQITHHSSGGPPEDLTIDLKEPHPALAPEL